MHDSLLIGIDGGGTRCRARLADAAGRTLAEAADEVPANVATHPPDAVFDAIAIVSRTAARQAGIGDAELRGACAGLGLAGAAVSSEREALLDLILAKQVFRKAEIRTDAYATWLGAHQGRDGAILILGTGSCGLAVVRGEEHYMSGGGPAISDEASAQWIGRAAVRRAFCALDGRTAQTPLARAIVAHLGGTSEAVISFGAKADAAAFGELAPLVFEYAEKNDPLALALLSEAAADAALMIARMLELGAPSVYLHGGLARRLSAWLPPPIRGRLAEKCDDGSVPLDGAILMAGRLAEALPAAARA